MNFGLPERSVSNSIGRLMSVSSSLRNQIGFDWYSNWEGFWLDLQTGEKRELEGRFMDEQVAFTGRGGEFFRCGPDGVRNKGLSGDRITGRVFLQSFHKAKARLKMSGGLRLIQSSQVLEC